MTHPRAHQAFVVCAVILAAALAVAFAERVAAGPPNDEKPPVVLHPEEIRWEERAQGVRAAVLYGDPARPGPFTLRLEYPAGYRKGPHIHPNDAFVTVLSGSYYRGYGNVVHEEDAHRLTPGTFSLNPGGVSHYEWTTEPAVLQVHAVGPWGTVYVDADGRPVGDE